LPAFSAKKKEVLRPKSDEKHFTKCLKKIFFPTKFTSEQVRSSFKKPAEKNSSKEWEFLLDKRKSQKRRKKLRKEHSSSK